MKALEGVVMELEDCAFPLVKEVVATSDPRQAFEGASWALIDGRPVPEVISDREWLTGEFVKTVQQRGAAVIKARGLSSAASAANAALDSVNSIRNPTPEADCAALAVVSRGEYGIPE